MDIEKMLKLACLHADSEQKKHLETDLKQIFDFFNQIKDVQVPSDDNSPYWSFLREDDVEDSSELREKLDDSKMKDFYFKTPPVIKSES